MAASKAAARPLTMRELKPDVRLALSLESSAQTLERRASSEHSLSLLTEALDRSARNLRRSMDLLIAHRSAG